MIPFLTFDPDNCVHLIRFEPIDKPKPGKPAATPKRKPKGKGRK